jgi:hypothetical protein
MLLMKVAQVVLLREEPVQLKLRAVEVPKLRQMKKERMPKHTPFAFRGRAAKIS